MRKHSIDLIDRPTYLIQVKLSHPHHRKVYYLYVDQLQLNTQFFSLTTMPLRVVPNKVGILHSMQY